MSGVKKHEIGDYIVEKIILSSLTMLTRLTPG